MSVTKKTAKPRKRTVAELCRFEQTVGESAFDVLRKVPLSALPSVEDAHDAEVEA